MAAINVPTVDKRKRIPQKAVDRVVLADELSLYAYDAYLLRCAAKYRLPLLTLDGRLAEAARKKKIQVLEVEE
jgi:predicted nucleic acid-binding protein